MVFAEQMTDEGVEVRRITPVGTLISLASLDSFPLEGGSLFCVGRDDSARPTQHFVPQKNSQFSIFNFSQVLRPEGVGQQL